MDNSTRSRGYKYCFVPQCDSSTKKYPSKIFVLVPREESIRKQWLKIVRRHKPTSTESRLYCCEDHFNLEEDLENYTRIKFDPGANVRLKKGSCPRFFECQKDRKRSFPEKHRPAAEKLKRIRLVQELLNDSQEGTHQDLVVDSTDSTNEGTSSIFRHAIQIKSNLIHFDDSQFELNRLDQKKLLKNNAIPTIFDRHSQNSSNDVTQLIHKLETLVNKNTEILEQTKVPDRLVCTEKPNTRRPISLDQEDDTNKSPLCIVLRNLTNVTYAKYTLENIKMILNFVNGLPLIDETGESENKRNLSNICRICLEKNNDMIKIDELQQTTEMHSLLIYFEIEISQVYGVPNHICRDCVARLQSTIDFRKSVRDAYQTISKELRVVSTIDEDICVNENNEAIPITTPITKTPLIEHAVPELELDVESDIEDCITDFNEKRIVSRLEPKLFTRLRKSKVHIYYSYQDLIVNKRVIKPLLRHCIFCEGKILFSSHRLHFHNHVALKHMVVCKFCSNKFNYRSYKKHIKFVKHEHTCPACYETVSFFPSNVKNNKIFCSCGTASVPDIPICKKESVINAPTTNDGSSSDFICYNCAKEFKSRAHLVLHEKHLPCGRTTLCEICGKSFKNHISLKVHLTSHTVVKKYKCNICLNSYSKQELLSKHDCQSRKKTKCQFCDKTFYSSSYRKLHERSHTGGKSYACECGKVFSMSSALRRHKRNIHSVQ